jgi:phosphoserine aminotransferase
MKKHNFYAGPSILPQFTIDETAKAVKDFAGTGLSVMEVSHRGKEFVAVMDEAQQLFKELLDIPAGYHVVFVGGGASTQFCMVPYNLMNKKSAYLNTGAWASKALKEAKLFGDVVEVASSKEDTFNYIPKGYEIPSDADYFHITTNNTIYGTEIKEDLDINIPLVADMSSDIFSRPVDISKYAIIYGGAQKNLAPSGVTFAIVKEDALGKVDRVIPTMLNYKTHIEKANLLYDEIDRNKLFKGTVVDPNDRSLMNICFVMNDEYKELEKDFMEFATSKGMVGIKGHRSVGGFRASTYNALPKESVEALVAAMKEFEKSK